MLLKFKERKQCWVRELDKIIGKLVPACSAMRFGYLYTKLLEPGKYLAMKHSKGPYDIMGIWLSGKRYNLQEYQRNR
nr:unnamed protein product [Callosobruchus chinensis]